MLVYWGAVDGDCEAKGGLEIELVRVNTLLRKSYPYRCWRWLYTLSPVSIFGDPSLHSSKQCPRSCANGATCVLLLVDKRLLGDGCSEIEFARVENV